jgi:PAS domain S-box-containing protein
MNYPSRTSLASALTISAVAAAYCVLARAGLLIALVPANASPLWPAAGFALAAVLLWGPRAALGVGLGACLANYLQFLSDQSAAPAAALAASVVIGLGNAGESLLGAALMRRAGITEELPRRAGQAAAFCALAPVIGLVASLLGPLVLVLGGILPQSLLSQAAATWWLGDTIGILVFTPLVLAWNAPWASAAPRSTAAHAAEGLAAAALLVVCAWLGLGGRTFPHAPHVSLTFITSPPLFWILLRFGPRFSTAAVAALAVYATWLTVQGGTFDIGPTIQVSLLLSSAYLTVLSSTTLLARALLEERQEALEELRLSHQGLQRHVDVALEIAAVNREEDKARVAMYRNVFDGLPIGIMVLRLEVDGRSDSLRIVEINPAGLRLSLAEGEKAEGAMLRDFSPTVFETELPEVCLDVLRTRESRVLHEYAGRKRMPGTFFHSRIFALSADCVGIAFENVTEQKTAQNALYESEQYMRLMLGNVRDYAIFRMDREGRVASCDGEAQAITGYSAEEILGKPYARFFAPEDSTLGLPQELMDTAARDGRVANEGWRLRKDGTRFWVSGVLAAIRDEGGALLGYVKIMHDDTERRQILQTLEKQSSALYRSNTELSQFAYVASHDLREPLHKVNAFADRLNEKLDGKLDEEGRDYLRRMLRAINGMQNLIDALLQLARVTTRVGACEVVDLEVLAKDVVDSLDISISRCKGRVELGEMPRIHADPLQMRQLLQNLISNAIKFQKPDAHPRVLVHGRLLGDGRCEIVVSDDGIGFEMKHAERIFKPFQRLHGRFEYEGTGIGLTICQKIAERHGGTITVKSAPGEGAEFRVVIPISQDGRTECEPREKAFS